jgi:protein-S-isoprenylcysteine O-methyltransferase Ste14
LFGGFFSVWLVLAFRDRPKAERHESLVSRLGYLVLVGAAAGLLVFDPIFYGLLLTRFLPQGRWIGLLGVLLAWLGMAFAIWARVQLGRNWSARISVRMDLQRIRTGPYALFRHPIHTGGLVAVIATALVIGEVRGLLALGLVVVALALKIRLEKIGMLERFGADYRRYQGEVNAIIPFLL